MRLVGYWFCVDWWIRLFQIYSIELCFWLLRRRRLKLSTFLYSDVLKFEFVTSHLGSGVGCSPTGWRGKRLVWPAVWSRSTSRSCRADAGRRETVRASPREEERSPPSCLKQKKHRVPNWPTRPRPNIKNKQIYYLTSAHWTHRSRSKRLWAAVWNRAERDAWMTSEPPYMMSSGSSRFTGSGQLAAQQFEVCTAFLSDARVGDCLVERWTQMVLVSFIFCRVWTKCIFYDDKITDSASGAWWLWRERFGGCFWLNKKDPNIMSSDT